MNTVLKVALTKNSLIQAALLTLLLLVISACGGGNDAPESSNFNPELSFDSHYQVTEGESVTVTFNLSYSTSHTVSFDYSTIENTALEGENFQIKKGSLTIAAGVTTASIILNTIDNASVNASDNILSDFSVNITNVTGANATKNSITVGINDNEPELSFDTKYTVTEGSDVAITLSLSEAASHRVGVNYVTSDGSGVADIDYKASNDVVYFEPGEISITLSLDTLLNLTTQEDVDYYFNITEVTGARVALTKSLIVVSDNEPEINFQNSFYIAEGSTAKIELTLEKSVSHSVRINTREKC